MLTARLFNCALCHQLVQICSCCDHGNIYCSEECSLIARKNSLHQANQRYQNTYKGKLKHSKRQTKYRHNKQQSQTSEKIVTDHSSIVTTNVITLSEEPVAAKNVETTDATTEVHCHFCGCLCSNLL